MSQPIPIYLVDAEMLRQHHSDSRLWQEACGFEATPGSYCLVPGSEGIDKVLVGRGRDLDTWTLGNLPQVLPLHQYALADDLSAETATRLSLGWALGQYRFTRYQKPDPPGLAELVMPKGADTDYVRAATTATYLTRDLINTPANDMGPAQLEAQARTLADTYGADLTLITGEELLSQNYPLIYAVGQASAQAPRLIDLRWGDPEAVQVTLVGKGVCFDTGGLHVKSGSGMQMMKKDMGGAAQVMGLANLIMAQALPLRLRLLVPAVENSIAGNAMHPLDVITSRKGVTVEIGNTDAEGRLVLADALAEASQASPDLLIDCATLTGAARVALGTELPACFCNHQETAEALLAAGQRVDDPLWQLPLHEPYRALLESKVADISNISGGSYGGAITAGLFLREFVSPQIPWIHIDLMAWNLRSLPGRPEGGEAMGMRALYELIRQRLTS
ncbi:putative cytosol aminopeptidase [Halomicronema hongdechloris C2206]|uniref:Probable cytosol aminopeptidase n=1 Tax=Halomicronema hongdechloris C2206 TaxID=1641165 RepID=A0A1Z3HPV1_9CYAN|nr:leucyl aminopeptidase family protein [Halomicronema hongdechloris]ASC72276.1 putative cytosol aminopeptidase [Halomicronema hongdechloris C2206]